MREQLRIGSRLCWVVAWGLAVAGPAVYLLWPGDVVWWVAPLGVVPLLFLAEWRREQHGLGEPGAAGDSSAWAPPAEHPPGL